jgi:GT2 family glycosyltransferase
MPSISVVIVSMNRRQEVLALIGDLAGRGAAGDDVTVVDNGSSDGTAEAIRSAFPAVRLIENGRNRGAPAGRAAGAAASKGDLLVFLDDDTRVEDRAFFDTVRRAFAAQPEAGAIAFRLLDPATRRSRSFEVPGRRKERAGEPFETTYFIAAGCAVRRSVHDAVGGMDPSLVYGFEELDFCYRAIGRGFRIFYRPEIVVLHGLSRKARPSWRRLYYFYRNKIWIGPRYLPWRMVVTQACAWSGYFLVEAVRTGRPDIFVGALCAGLAGLPESLRRRRKGRLTRAALDRLRTLEGRLYY